MLGGIVGTELEALRNDSSQARRGTWSDIGAEFRNQAQQLPGFRRHLAVNGLLSAVANARLGRASAVSELTNARAWAADDSENLVSRICVAYIDETSQPGMGGSTQQRFESARKIIEGAKAATVASLYQDGLNRLWLETIRRHIRRADVASSLARHSLYERQDQFAALPAITLWLLDIAAMLKKEGKVNEANQCTGWIRQSMPGIIDNETDPATRLLAADLLAKALPHESAASAGLRKLRDDFHHAANGCALDMTDIYHKCPATQREYYPETVDDLFLAARFEFAAVGAFMLLLVSLAGALLSRPTHGHVEPVVGIARPSLPVSLVAGIALVAFTLARPSVLHRAVTSELGLFLSVSCWLAVGALWSIAASADGLRRRIGLRMLLWATVALVILAPATLGKAPFLIRAIDLRMSSAVALSVILVLLLGAALWICGLPSSLQAHMAVRAWMMMSILAFVALQAHRWHDRLHQSRVVAARMDEFAARLGDNWKEKYLSAMTNPSATQP